MLRGEDGRRGVVEACGVCCGIVHCSRRRCRYVLEGDKIFGGGVLFLARRDVCLGGFRRGCRVEVEVETETDAVRGARSRCLRNSVLVLLLDLIHKGLTVLVVQGPITNDALRNIVILLQLLLLGYRR